MVEATKKLMTGTTAGARDPFLVGGQIQHGVDGGIALWHRFPARLVNSLEEVHSAIRYFPDIIGQHEHETKNDVP